jgi:hypothetical protein
MPLRPALTAPRRAAIAAALVVLVAAGALVVVHRRAGPPADCGDAPLVTAGAANVMDGKGDVSSDILPGYPSNQFYDVLLKQVEEATRDRGPWFAGDFASGGNIAIGFTADVTGARAEIQAKVPDAGYVVVYGAPYTWSQIHYGVMKVMNSTGRAGIPWSSIGEDILHDRIHVTLPQLRPDWVQQLRAQYGCLLTFSQGGPGLAL